MSLAHLEAQPIQQIRSVDNKRVVGWLYRWNNGDHVALWLDGPRTDVLYRPIASAPSQAGERPSLR